MSIESLPCICKSCNYLGYPVIVKPICLICCTPVMPNDDSAVSWIINKTISVPYYPFFRNIHSVGVEFHIGNQTPGNGRYNGECINGLMCIHCIFVYNMTPSIQIKSSHGEVVSLFAYPPNVQEQKMDEKYKNIVNDKDLINTWMLTYKTNYSKENLFRLLESHCLMTISNLKHTYPRYQLKKQCRYFFPHVKNRIVSFRKNIALHILTHSLQDIIINYLGQYQMFYNFLSTLHK